MAWDRFSYTLNNPVRFSDPSGHKACEEGEHGKCENGKSDPLGDIYQPTPLPSSTYTASTNDSSNSPQPIISYSKEYGLCILGMCSGGSSYATWWREVYLPVMLDYYQKGYLSDMVFLWGGSGSTSSPSIYSTGGVEEIVFLNDGTRATFSYGGHGNSVGVGASGTAYFGFASNVQSPEDYKGVSSSMGITISIGEGGVSAAYFWNGNYAPLTPGVVQGIQLGYAPGAQVSAWWSNVLYELTWTNE